MSQDSKGKGKATSNDNVNSFGYAPVIDDDDLVDDCDEGDGTTSADPPSSIEDFEAEEIARALQASLDTAKEEEALRSGADAGPHTRRSSSPPPTCGGKGKEKAPTDVLLMNKWQGEVDTMESWLRDKSTAFLHSDGMKELREVYSGLDPAFREGQFPTLNKYMEAPVTEEHVNYYVLADELSYLYFYKEAQSMSNP